MSTSYSLARCSTLRASSDRSSIRLLRSRQPLRRRRTLQISSSKGDGDRLKSGSDSTELQLKLIPALLSEDKGVGVLTTGALVKSVQAVGKGVMSLSGRVSNNGHVVRAQPTDAEEAEASASPIVSTSDPIQAISSEEYSAALAELLDDMQKGWLKIISQTPASTAESIIEGQTFAAAVEQLFEEAEKSLTVETSAAPEAAAVAETIEEVVEEVVVAAPDPAPEPEVAEPEPAPVVVEEKVVEEKESLWVLAARAVGAKPVKGAKPAVEPKPEKPEPVPLPVVAAKPTVGKPVKGPKPAAPLPVEPTLKSVPKEVTKGGRHISMLSAPMGVAASAFGLGGGAAAAKKAVASVGGGSGGTSSTGGSSSSKKNEFVNGGGSGSGDGGNGGGGGGNGGNGGNGGKGQPSQEPETPLWFWILLLIILLVVLYIVYQKQQENAK